MLLNYALTEIKKWTRDSLLLFMLAYPFLFGALGAFVVPAVLDQFAIAIDPKLLADIVLVMLAMMTPIIFGFVVGFSIMDDRDDHIIDSIMTSPLEVFWFIWIKLIMIYIFSFVATIIIFYMTFIGLELSFDIFWRFILIAAVISLVSIQFTLLINAIAKNKIEGFAVVKGMGILAIVPVASLFITDWREYFFGLIPQFWPAKAISANFNELNLEWWVYLLIGAVVISITNWLLYKWFERKVVRPL
jgi:fluoroquinolone transport system permease protein